MTSALEDRLLDAVARIGPATAREIAVDAGLYGSRDCPMGRVYRMLDSLHRYDLLNYVEGPLGRLYAVEGQELPRPHVPKARGVAAVIDAIGPCTVGEIAEATGFTPDDVRRAIDVLRRRGYRSDGGTPPRYGATRSETPPTPPAREDIAELLRDGDATAQELAHAMGRPLTTIHTALKTLTDAGVVESHGFKGRSILWGLVP